MVHLCKDPEGESVLGPSSAADTDLSSRPKSVSTAAEVTNHNSEVASLKQKISALEKQLAEVRFTLVNYCHC